MSDFCECGEPWVRHGGTYETLVGYGSPPGHNHDDNCRKREYVCRAGHPKIISRQNRCPKGDWEGKMTCFCHKGEKVKEWPKIGVFKNDAA